MSDYRNRPDYRADYRRTHSLRFRDDTWDELIDQAGLGKENRFIELGAEVMCDQVRCPRCGRAVPVELGDLTGMIFSEAAFAALDAVRRQKCRAHQPVKVSSGGGADGDAGLADLRTKVEAIEERLAPTVTPSPVPFRPPAVTR